jgi:endonuclease YncB( thermonuclease family)
MKIIFCVVVFVILTLNIVVSDTRYYQIKGLKLYKIKNVIDGDTIQLESGEIIRLLGVYAPEKGKKGYDFAKKQLKSLLISQYVEIERVGKDIFNRTYALFYYPHGCLNGILRQNYNGKNVKKLDDLLTKKQRKKLEICCFNKTR